MDSIGMLYSLGYLRNELQTANQAIKELQSQLHQCREREKEVCDAWKFVEGTFKEYLALSPEEAAKRWRLMLAVVKIAEETVGQKPTCPDCKPEPACLGCDWLEGRQRLKDALAALDSEGVE